MCISGLTIPGIRWCVWSESPRQLIRETRLPLAAGPGAPARHDFEYERCGVCNVFMAVEPLASKRTVQIRERRTKTDWAHFLNDIARPYPCAEKITPRDGTI